MDSAQTVLVEEQESLRLRGSVERVTFHSADSGFCVLRVKVPGKRDLQTVTGSIPKINVGEYVEAGGRWVNDYTYGLQFKAESLRSVPPDTREGMEKYLGSGMIRGIGPHFAKKLVGAFGEEVFDVIEHQPERLLELPGIGKKRHEQVIVAWAEQKAVREIMVFLQSRGVGTSRAARIYKTYGDSAIEKITENPYRLAQDIHGIGFKTADTIAEKLGIPHDSIIRARAGVRYTLQEMTQEGHCAAPRRTLAEEASKLLGINTEIIQMAISDELTAGNLISEVVNDEPCLFLTPMHRAETGVARHLKRLQTGVPPWRPIDIQRAIPWVEQKTGLILSASQRAAVDLATRSKVLVITGGPGVGKTTLVNSILKILGARHVNVALCAPTGRAAKRLKESTGLEAQTIHRLLIFDPDNGGFKHDADNLLDLELLVIDEASMIDIVLMNQLLRAIPDRAALIIVGDVDQLPSVGPGAVLADLLNAGNIAAVRLTEIFRQAATSEIIVNAHRINQGLMPAPPATEVREARAPYGSKPPVNSLSDFYLIAADTPEDIMDKLFQVVIERIPKRFGLDPMRDIQILTPMNRGGLGARSLNVALQERLNPDAQPRINRFGWSFAPGDKIIQTINNYDKEVFNGDIGIIVEIDVDDDSLLLRFDDREVVYSADELDEVSLAYATTIHKSQGSEYPAVVIPLAMQHYMLLERNLIYTGITRGKKLVVIIGQHRALAMGVKQQRAGGRMTNLAARLKEM